jgi:LysM repeat protein
MLWSTGKELRFLSCKINILDDISREACGENPMNLEGEIIMKDDPEYQTNNDRTEGSAYSPRRRPAGSGDSKTLRIVLVILVMIIVAGSVIYFLKRQPAGGKANPLESKVAALEEKVNGLQNQLAELQGKMGAPGLDPALLQRVDALAQKVEALEKRKQPTAELKPKPPTLSKRPVSSGKQYHTVQKGESLIGISKRYGISVKDLRKMNNLSANQQVRPGQKLLVSTGR